MASGTRAPSTIITVSLNGQTDFNIPFEYLARKFVVVTLLGIDRKVLTLNTDYRFVSRTTISLANPTPAGYVQLELRRETSATERLVDFHDGSILRAYDLNLSQIQTLHVAEEARDLTADTLGVNDEGHLDARGRKLVNLAYAESGGDAIPLAQVVQWNDSALVSAGRAENAAFTAEAANAGAQAAKDVAVSNAAQTGLDRAVTQADAAITTQNVVLTNEDVVKSESAADRAEAAGGPATAVFERLEQVETTAAEAVEEAKSLALPVLSAAWVQLRTAMWNGYVAADGQLLKRADYPDAWAAINAGKVPVTSDALWFENPTFRGCFTTGDGSTTFRVPDYNGVTEGSVGAAFLRGDGLNSEGVNGVIQRDAIRNIKGKMTNEGWSILGNSSMNIADSPLYVTSEGSVRYGSTVTDTTWGNIINIDVSRSVPTAADNHPVSVTGCWAIKLFGVVQNAGAIDAATLATQLAEAQSKIAALESRRITQVVDVLWEGYSTYAGELLPLSQPLVAGDMLTVEHNDSAKLTTAAVSLVPNKMAADQVLYFPFSATATTSLRYVSENTLKTDIFTAGYAISKVYRTRYALV